MRSRNRTLPVVSIAVALLAVGCDAQEPGATRSAGTPIPAGMDTLAADVDVGYTLGDPDAPIAVVEFSDFGCPYCARFAQATLPTIMERYVDEGLVRWRYVPVSFGFPGGQLMGAAAECAAELGPEGVFWEVHDLFYRRQPVLRSPDARPRVLDWLAELGVDRDELDRCIDAPATQQQLAAHNRAAEEWLVRGTPTFVINGAPLSGALPLPFFERVFATMLDPSGL